MNLGITTFPRLYDEPDAIPFINAIVLHPDDDTNRLVFADWLEENAYRDEEFSDHYLARCEFIRIGCNSLGGSLKRISRAEGEWLDTNWRRLVPTLNRWFDSEPYRSTFVPHNFTHTIERSGRRISVRYTFTQGNRTFLRWVCSFDAIRGFTNFSTYNSRSTITYRCLLMDDPVAEPMRYTDTRSIRNNFNFSDGVLRVNCDCIPYVIYTKLRHYVDNYDDVIAHANKNLNHQRVIYFKAETDDEARDVAILSIRKAMRKWVKETINKPQQTIKDTSASVPT